MSVLPLWGSVLAILDPDREVLLATAAPRRVQLSVLPIDINHNNGRRKSPVGRTSCVLKWIATARHKGGDKKKKHNAIVLEHPLRLVVPPIFQRRLHARRPAQHHRPGRQVNLHQVQRRRLCLKPRLGRAGTAQQQQGADRHHHASRGSV